MLLEERVLQGKIPPSAAGADSGTGAVTVSDAASASAAALSADAASTAAGDAALSLWSQLHGVPAMPAALQSMAQYFTQNPFADLYPVVMEHANFAQQGATYNGTWFLCDPEGHARQLSCDGKNQEELHEQVVSCLALTGGHEFTAIVLLNDVQTILCGVVYEGRFLPLNISKLFSD